MSFVTNVFTQEELEIIHKDLDERLRQPGWHTWERAKDKISEASHAEAEYPHEQGSITFKYITGEIKDLLRQVIMRIDPKTRGYDFTAFYQVWDVGAATGMHDDTRYLYNATFYLNKIWRPDDGGLYVYLDGAEYKVFVPEYNSCAYINQDKVEPHLVTPVTTNALEKRYTIHCKGALI